MPWVGRGRSRRAAAYPEGSPYQKSKTCRPKIGFYAGGFYFIQNANMMTEEWRLSEYPVTPVRYRV